MPLWPQIDRHGHASCSERGNRSCYTATFYGTVQLPIARQPELASATVRAAP